MMKKSYALLVLCLILCFTLSCSKDSNEETIIPESNDTESNDPELLRRARSLFTPITSNPVQGGGNNLTDAKIRLGKVLFFDTRLSQNNTISCASCHNLSNFGVDNLSLSPGVGGQLGTRNSSTVVNAAYHFRQFWDGRVGTVEEQAGHPILNAVEMAMPNQRAVETKLQSIGIYPQLFANAYPGTSSPITFENTTQAIGAFVRTLSAPSRFDSYLNGNNAELTASERNGLRTFMDRGCVSCHSGPAVGGGMFQKFGVFANYWEFTNSTIIDNGRFDVTGNESDRYFFKVASLRNAAQTAPYFHDGSVSTLENAISTMGRVQLNVQLSNQEISDLASFINSLSGSVPEAATVRPNELN